MWHLRRRGTIVSRIGRALVGLAAPATGVAVKAAKGEGSWIRIHTSKTEYRGLNRGQELKNATHDTVSGLLALPPGLEPGTL